MNVQDAMQAMDRAQGDISQIFAGSTAWQVPWEMMGLYAFVIAMLGAAVVYEHRSRSMRSTLVAGISCVVVILTIGLGMGHVVMAPFDRLHDRFEQAQGIRDSFADAGGCDAIIPAIRNGSVVHLDPEQDGFVQAACGQLVADAAHLPR